MEESINITKRLFSGMSRIFRQTERETDITSIPLSYGFVCLFTKLIPFQRLRQLFG